MATLRDIKRKIHAVKKTQQITRAMNMVAAAKLRGAQQQMEQFRPYARKFDEVLQSLAGRTDPDLHLLLQRHEKVSRIELIAMSADRGLCGSFNTNLLTAEEKFIREKKDQGLEVALITVGRKARDYFRRRNAFIRNSHTDIGAVTFDLASRISQEFTDSFQFEECDEVHIIYSHFINIAIQKPVTVRLLPLRAPEVEKPEGDDETRGIEYLYEPSPEALMEAILPHYIRIRIFQALLENNTSEHAARMAAMDNATKNCKDMIDNLTLVFNKARQAAITKELMDIVGGAEALRK